jgi:hypothetical protein
MTDPYRVTMRECCNRSVEQEHAPNCKTRYPSKAERLARIRAAAATELEVDALRDMRKGRHW